MITDVKILGTLYTLLNVAGVTGLINGELWKVSKPVDRQLEDIVLNSLTNLNTNNHHLNIGVININSFTRANADHTANTLRLQAIHDAIITALDIVGGQLTYGLLNGRIEQQKTFRDNDDPLMFFSNIRINFSYKN